MCKKTVLLITVLMAVAGTFSAYSSGDGEAGGQAKDIIIGHGLPDESGLGQGFLIFKEELEKRSGNFSVEIFPNQALGGDRQLTESTQLGNVTMTAVSATNLAPFSKEFFIFDTFFTFRDTSHVDAVLDGKAGQRVLEGLDNINLKGLGFWENGFRYLTNSKRPIMVPADMNGIKMRVPENPLQIAAWKSVGAGPTPMAWGEIFTALQQKTLDGQECSIDNVWSMKFNEVQEYISLTGHKYSPYVLIVNKEFYDALNGEDKTAFDEAVSVSIFRQREVARGLAEEALDLIKSADTSKINELNAEDKLAFRKLMATATIDQVKERTGGDLFDFFMAEVDNN